MRLRFSYFESFMTYVGKGEYVVDTDKFPELSGLTEEQAIEWVFKNRSKLGVDYSYDDHDKRTHDITAYEVVPRNKEDKEQGRLVQSMIDLGMEWEKIVNEEDNFEFIRNMDEKQETYEEMMARMDREVAAAMDAKKKAEEGNQST